MIISRSVFNKISKVVFSTTEPSSTLVLWGKPSDPYYDFYIYEAGTWQYVAGVQEESGEVVPLPNIPSKLSEYTNDVGFITEVDLADYLEEHGFTPGGGGGASSWDDIEDKPIKVAGFSAIDITRDSLYPETIAAITALKNSGIALGDLVLVNYDSTNTTSAIVATVSSVSPFRMTFFCRDKFVSLSEEPENVYSSKVIDLSTLYPLSIDGIPYEDLDSSVQASLDNANSALQTQIQSDWNQTTTTAKDYIKNKPTIPDTSNFVQKSQTSGLLKNDGTVDTNTYLTSHQDISGKANKVVVVDASTLPSTLDPNKVYQMGTLTGSVTIPAFSAVASGDTEAKIWCFTFNTSTTAPTITWPAAITNWVGGSAPTINASKKYEVTVMDGIGAIMEA